MSDSPPPQTGPGPEAIEFLNLAMHELRSPLVTIRGYVEMIAQGRLGSITPAQKSRLHVVWRNSLAMDDMIDTMMEYARIEQDRFVLSRDAVPIAPLARKATKLLAELAERSGTQFTEAIEVSDHVLVDADADRVRRVIRALLDNAIKFTSEGEITLRVVEREADVEISVTDTGSGITQTDLPLIFDPFFKGSDKDGAQRKGTGLGLTVASQVIRAHGSSLRCEPRELGARFSFRLPLD
jgi:two-component system, OmpR family, sensor histidine kinase ResE